MSEAIYLSLVSTTVDALVSLVRVSPWSVPTYVLDPRATTANVPEQSRVQPGYSIPEEVDIRGWLELTERTLDFWDNDEDSVYDNY